MGVCDGRAGAYAESTRSTGPSDRLVEKLRDAGVPDEVSTLVLDSVADSDLGSLMASYGHVPAIRVGPEGIAQYQSLLTAHGLETGSASTFDCPRPRLYTASSSIVRRKGEFRAICGGGRTTTAPGNWAM